MPPTLLQKGSLRGHPDAVPISFITEALRKYMPEFGSLVPTSLKDRFFIAKSETGSGKSTALPAHVFRLLRDHSTPVRKRHIGRSVICTQPRVLTAVTLARDMAGSPHYPELALPNPNSLVTGERSGTVGFQTSPNTNKPPNGLIYATAGILLVQLRAAAAKGDFSEVAQKYAFVIVDEAHERSLDTDATLMLLKQMILSGIKIGGEYARRLPIVILASATISVEAYAKFFELLDDRGIPFESNCFHVVGRQHGIVTRWPKVGTNDYLSAAIEAAKQVHLSEVGDPPDQRDILIFMPGAAETKKVVTGLEKLRDEGKLDSGGPVVILPINREAVNQETSPFRLMKAPLHHLWNALESQELYTPEKLAQMREKGLHVRRIVVSTVVAETGLTIETLKYVIESGWQRGSEKYQPFGIGGLITRPAAKSRIKQRKGRAGRLFPGVFLPLYTQNVFEMIPDQQLPDVVIEGGAPIILDIILGQQMYKRLQYTPGAPASELEFRINDIDMLDAPPPDALISAFELANALGFCSPTADLLGRPAEATVVDEVVGRGLGLTLMGRIASQFPRIDLTLRRLVMGAPLWQCAVADLATIAAVCIVCADRGFSNILSKKGRRKADSEKGLRKMLSPALEAALPIFMPRSADKARLFFQDDLIEGLLIFEAFSEEVQRHVGHESALDKIDKWCLAHNLGFEGMAQLASARERVLEEMVAAGLNPFWGCEYRLLATRAQKFPAQVQALKRCMFDAFRLNLLEPQESRRSKTPIHVTRFGLTVSCPGASTLNAVGRTVVTPLVAVTTKTAPEPRGGAAASSKNQAPSLRWELQAALLSVLDTALPETRVAPSSQLLAPKEKSVPE